MTKWVKQSKDKNQGNTHQRPKEILQLWHLIIMLISIEKEFIVPIITPKPDKGKLLQILPWKKNKWKEISQLSYTPLYISYHGEKLITSGIECTILLPTTFDQ